MAIFISEKEIVIIEEGEGAWYDTWGLRGS